MNYKPMIIEKLKEFSDTYPEYSVGQMLYAMMRRKSMKGKPEGISTAWIMDISDSDIYSAIDKAILNEKE